MTTRVTFAKPRDIDHKAQMMKALREAADISFGDSRDAIDAGWYDAEDGLVPAIICEFNAAGLYLGIPARGPLHHAATARRPYSGPSRAERLVAYRAAALASLIPDVSRGEHEATAALAEKMAHAMLAAERNPGKGAGK